MAVDFSNVTFRSRSTTTLQVVSNPILDRTFTAPNGTEFDNPIHDAAFESLANLHADLVSRSRRVYTLNPSPLCDVYRTHVS